MCSREAHPSGSCPRAYLLVKPAELAKFVRHRHALQVLVVSYRLKIPTYQEQIDFVFMSLFQISDVLVNRIQLPMATSLDCDLFIVRDGGGAAELELAFIRKVAKIEATTEEGSRDRSHRVV